MKSYSALFSDLYEALTKDFALVFPTLEDDFGRDLSRLRQALSHEGIGFITLTHLEMNAFFRNALAVGSMRYSADSQPPRGFGAKSSLDIRPRYLHGLLSLVFDEKGMLLENVDSNAIALISQWLLVGKKVELECSDDRLEAALSDFIVVDSELPHPHADTWDDNHPKWVRRDGHPLWGVRQAEEGPLLFGVVPDQHSEIDWTLFRALSARFRSSLGSVPWSDLRPKHGRGAVADGDGLKYEFRHWPEKLQAVFPWDYYGSSDFGTLRRELGREPDSREYPSVVLAVPKTQKGPRIICKEPIAHQWMQGALERWLYAGIQRTFLSRVVDFKDQSLSQALALDASRTGDMATVDLSNASDRLSCRLVEYVFQGGDNSALDALHACRSRYFIIGKSMMRFRKFAPAGSACTFPVQSVVFSLLAMFAVMRTRNWGLDKLNECAGLVRVYGDDIIIPTDAYGELCMIFSSVGLKVNTSKSYHTGLFRESCGMDAYDGVDVTPAYVKRMYKSSDHTSLESVVQCANNLFMKGYWYTSDCLLKTIPEKERKLLIIGHKDGGAVSLYSFMGDYPHHLKARWSDTLHKFEYRAIMLRVRTITGTSDGDAGLVQFFNEEPDPESLYASGQVLRVSSTKATGWV